MASGGEGVEGTLEALKHSPDSRHAMDTNRGRWGRSRFRDRAPLRAVRAPNDARDTAFMRDGKAESSGVMLTIVMERPTSMGASVAMVANARGQKKRSVATSQQRTLAKHRARDAACDGGTLGCKVAM